MRTVYDRCRQVECPKVTIVILNWNSKKHLSECLPSVFNQSYPNYEVILVDNGSTDGSVEFVRENYPQVKIIKLDKNYGTAKGYNIGIEEALKDENVRYIAFLDNDTKADRNWLSELVKAAENDEEMRKKVGMWASKILRMDNPKVIDTTGVILKWWGTTINRGRGEIDRGQFDNKLNIFCANTTSCLFKREMFEEVGLFDESFFADHELPDLAWRARKKGWKAKYVPTSIVYHRGGGTTKRSEEFERKMIFLATRNRTRVVKRHGILLQKILYMLFLLKTAAMSELGKRLRKNSIGAEPYMKALKYLWCDEK